MTRLFVNDQEIAMPAGVFSLTDVVKYVEDSQLPPNTVIRQIDIDGIPFAELPDEKISMQFKIEEIEKIGIYTCIVADVALESVQEALQYLGRIEAAIPSVAAALQSLPGPDAFDALKQLYEGLYWLNVLVEKLRLNFSLNLESMLVLGTAASEHNRKFLEVLKQLIESQQQGDTQLTAELLEYEMLPLVPVWKETFEVISEQIRAAA